MRVCVGADFVIGAELCRVFLSQIFGCQEERSSDTHLLEQIGRFLVFGTSIIESRDDDQLSGHLRLPRVSLRGLWVGVQTLLISKSWFSVQVSRHDQSLRFCRRRN